jgi:hypothetical protein
MHAKAQDGRTSASNSTLRDKTRTILSELLTSNEVARELHTSASVMRGLINARELTPLGKVGPMMVFWKSDVEALKEKRRRWREGRDERPAQ